MSDQREAAIETLAGQGVASKDELESIDDMELYARLFELGYDWDGDDWTPAGDEGEIMEA